MALRKWNARKIMFVAFMGLLLSYWVITDIRDAASSEDSTESPALEFSPAFSRMGKANFTPKGKKSRKATGVDL